MAVQHEWRTSRGGGSDTPARLTEDEVQQRLGQLSDWSGDAQALTRVISEPPGGLHDHLRRVLDLSPHGGELDQEVDRLIVTLRTESAHGVTAYDIALAQRINDVLIDAGPAIEAADPVQTHSPRG
jgi:pterin-4a-carbinolamine dehydratase